jgi:hypothetical protein
MRNGLELPVEIGERVEAAVITHLRNVCFLGDQQFAGITNPDLG